MGKQQDNEIFVVETVDMATTHTRYTTVVAKDVAEAEKIMKRRFKLDPVFDMSDGIIVGVGKIDRSKKGIVEKDDQ